MNFNLLDTQNAYFCADNYMCQDVFIKAEKLLSSFMNEWASTLAASNTLHPVWSQILKDPFLRRLLLR